MTAHDIRRAAVNGPTLTGALLKVHSAFVLLLAGLLLEQVAQDTLLADRLPPQLELCMAGRGLLPLLRMPPNLQGRLNRFMHRPMSPGHPVQVCPWHPSPLPGQEAAMGAVSYHEPGSDPYRQFRIRQPQNAPQQLIFAFLMDFRSEFPADFATLFPNVLGTNGALSGRAAQIIRQAAENTAGSSVPMTLTAMFTALMTE